MKAIYTLILITALATSSNAQSIIGSWGGKIDIGTRKVLFIMHLSKDGDKYYATFDSPDQNSFDLKGGEAFLIADSVNAKIPSMNAGYLGKWNGKDEMSGLFTQGNFKTSLALRRLNEAEVPKNPLAVARPQTPKKPYAYNSETVEYNNADGTVHFGATLTTPLNSNNFPTVIIISGSGPQDRDGTIMGHKPYWVLADYLTARGIGVLRVDDRGTGLSTVGPNPLKLTSADFANDVESSIQFLLSRKEINPTKIGLIGHSEGGMIAPMVAARNKNVAFITLLAGPGTPSDQIWKYQMRRNFVKLNLTPTDSIKAADFVNSMNDAFKQSTEYATIKKTMQDTYINFKNNTTNEEESRLLNSIGDKAYIGLIDQFKNGLTWLNYFMNYDPAINLAAIKCPVLAVNGESDIQITSKENLAGIQKALKKAKNKHYMIHSFPNLNHLFQTCKSPSEPYNTIDETFSPIALDYISNWINKTIR